jgi:hypothetical protein
MSEGGCYNVGYDDGRNRDFEEDAFCDNCGPPNSDNRYYRGFIEKLVVCQWKAIQETCVNLQRMHKMDEKTKGGARKMKTKVIGFLAILMVTILTLPATDQSIAAYAWQLDVYLKDSPFGSEKLV